MRRGLTTADLKVHGKVPDDKEKLMMFVRVGSRSSVNSKGVMLVEDLMNKN